MRKIKFRAWDKKEKKWLGVNLHMSVIDGFLWWQFGYGCDPLSANEDIELMQYTGLIDKNGKEIYENDICRFITWENNYEIEIPTIDIIEFGDGSFTFEDLALYEWMDEDHRIELEVIGNKFENQELLK